MGAVGKPFDKTSPSTIFKTRRTDEKKYKVDKVLKDGKAKVVSGATTTVFDRQSGRLFIGGKNTNTCEMLFCEVIMNEIIDYPFLVECTPETGSVVVRTDRKHNSTDNRDSESDIVRHSRYLTRD